jgi:preprotein translocase subunit YajC
VDKKQILSGGLIGLMLAGLVGGVALLSGCSALTGGSTDSSSSGSSIWTLVIFVVLLFVMMYFTMIRPQMKRQKEHTKLMEGLQKGDKVMTAGGILGTIDSISEDSVVIKVESGAMLRVVKGSIAIRQQ